MRAQRGGADLGVLARQQPVGERQVVAAPRAVEDLERPQHHRPARVVQDQRRDQGAATLADEQVHRGDHLDVVAAVEAGEERLERVEVQLGQGAGLVEHAFAQRLPTFAQRPTEHLDVVGDELVGRSHPDDAQRCGGAGQGQVAPAELQLAQDEQRRDRLPAALAEDVDDRLDPCPQRVGDGQEQQLRAGAVHGVTERAVSALEEQRGRQPGADGHRGGAREEQDRHQPQRTVQAHPAQQPAHQHELRDEREDVQHHVEAGEEAGQVLRRHVTGHVALEHEVAERHRHGRDEHEAGEPRHVGLLVDQLAGFRERPAQRRPDRGLAAAAPEQQRRAQGGRRHQQRRRRDELRRPQLAAHDPRQERARHGAEQAARADEPVDALGLRDREDLPEHQPELQRGQRRDEPGPHVQGAQAPGAAESRQRPEDGRDQGHRSERGGEPRPPEQPVPAPRRDLGQGHGDRGHRQVHPGQLGRRQPGQEQRIPGRLEDGVRGDHAEEREERRVGGPPFLGPDLG